MSEHDQGDELYDLSGLARSLARSLAAIVPVELAAVELTLPPRPEFGDVSTPVALAVAKRAGRKPREIADELGERWCAGAGAAVCDRYEVAGPGFLNLFLKDDWYRGAARRSEERRVG
jgi:arginyl-tRNA synthetase